MSKKHQKCTSPATCSIVLPWRDQPYHMATEHCALCGAFRDRWKDIPCRPRKK